MKVRPLHDRVLLKRLEQKEMIKGGIIIPDTAKEKPMEGEVIAGGPGKLMDDGKRSPMDVKAGDRVLFGKYSGTEIKIDDEELWNIWHFGETCRMKSSRFFKISGSTQASTVTATESQARNNKKE